MDEATVQATLAEHGEKLKSLCRRMDNVERLTESVHSLAISQEKVTASLTNLTEKVDKVSGVIDEMQAKPAKYWAQVITSIISALVGAGIAMFIK